METAARTSAPLVQAQTKTSAFHAPTTATLLAWLTLPFIPTNASKKACALRTLYLGMMNQSIAWFVVGKLVRLVFTRKELQRFARHATKKEDTRS